MNKKMLILCIIEICVFCVIAVACPPPPYCPPCHRYDSYEGGCVWNCGDNTSCCNGNCCNGYCCSSCCSGTGQCCGGGCCASPNWCCDNKTCYDHSSEYCCYNGTGKTCPTGDECCGDKCCEHKECKRCVGGSCIDDCAIIPGEICCEGNCCLPGLKCCPAIPGGTSASCAIPCETKDGESCSSLNNESCGECALGPNDEDCFPSEMIINEGGKGKICDPPGCPWDCHHDEKLCYTAYSCVTGVAFVAYATCSMVNENGFPLLSPQCITLTLDNCWLCNPDTDPEHIRLHKVSNDSCGG